ncbi:MAG: hypothetical protein HYZ84_07065 [Candidatus Omnitrophica bacterium]|nr:hypothetical protein [Candidatus Omnitrophota bacterium]
MEISHQVVKPLLDRLLQEYKKMYREICAYSSDAPNFLELKSQIEDKLNQLKIMNMLGGFHAIHGGTLTTEEQGKLRENLRNLKLDERFLARRWKRHLVSENRFRRLREKRNHVSTIAA